MKLCLFICVFSARFLGGSAAAAVFDGVLGNTVSCNQQCTLTYSLHTYPREVELFACQRGCRLFSICQFVGDSENLNQTKSECESACTEAYDETEEEFACSLGCQNQLPFAEQRQEQLLAMMPRIHLLYPLALMKGFWEDMMSQANEFITSSWTFYLQADDGKVIVFQSGPELEFGSPVDLQRSELMESPHSSDPEINQPLYREYRSTGQERLEVMTRDRSSSLDDYPLFRCFSRSPWLPGWILTTTLILSVLVLIWICCATMATAADQYIPADKLSIYGDLEYMKEQKLKPYPQAYLPMVTPAVKEKETQAFPLKINMNLTEV